MSQKYQMRPKHQKHEHCRRQSNSGFTPQKPDLVFIFVIVQGDDVISGRFCCWFDDTCGKKCFVIVDEVAPEALNIGLKSWHLMIPYNL